MREVFEARVIAARARLDAALDVRGNDQESAYARLGIIEAARRDLELAASHAHLEITDIGPRPEGPDDV